LKVPELLCGLVVSDTFGPVRVMSPPTVPVIEVGEVLLVFSALTSLVIAAELVMSTESSVPSDGSNCGRLWVRSKLVSVLGNATV
jgi:hypothetical protein